MAVARYIIRPDPGALVASAVLPGRRSCLEDREGAGPALDRLDASSLPQRDVPRCQSLFFGVPGRQRQGQVPAGDRALLTLARPCAETRSRFPCAVAFSAVDWKSTPPENAFMHLSSGEPTGEKDRQLPQLSQYVRAKRNGLRNS
jgi:hypothetical protein